MTWLSGMETNGRNDGEQLAIDAIWERPIIADEGGETALLVRIAAPPRNDAGPRAPVDVAFVLDRSGSMSGGNLELAKVGVDLGVVNLRDADRVAAVVYDNEVELVQPLDLATSRVKASLRLALHGVDPRGSTFLSGGWLAGCKELAEAPTVEGGGARIRRVILLTDGLANVGIVDPRELARHAGELRKRGIATTTVGVGQDFDEGLLSALAEAGGGHFAYAADPEALRAFFARELRQMASVAVTGLKITLTLPPGMAAEMLSVFPAEQSDGALEVAIGDLHGEDEIALIFVVRAVPGPAGPMLPVTVRATWTDALADQTRETKIGLDLLRRGTAKELTEVASESLVLEEAALQRAAIERRAALDLDRQGDVHASRQRLAMAHDLLLAAPATARIAGTIAEQHRFDLPWLDAPVDSAARSHYRKAAQSREDQRRRGRPAE